MSGSPKPKPHDLRHTRLTGQRGHHAKALRGLGGSRDWGQDDPEQSDYSHQHIDDSHDSASSARPLSKGPELHLLQPHLVDQMIVGRGLNDAVELGPVGADEADTVEGDIVCPPPRADQVEPVVNGELVLLANGDLGTDRGVLTIYRLTEVLHSLPRVILDLAEVQVFQDPLEEASELLPLLGRPVGPVPPQAAPGHLGEVEEGLDNPLDLLATPRGGSRPLLASSLHPSGSSSNDGRVPLGPPPSLAQGIGFEVSVTAWAA